MPPGGARRGDARRRGAVSGADAVIGRSSPLRGPRPGRRRVLPPLEGERLVIAAFVLGDGDGGGAQEGGRRRRLQRRRRRHCTCDARRRLRRPLLRRALPRSDGGGNSRSGAGDSKQRRRRRSQWRCPHALHGCLAGGRADLFSLFSSVSPPPPPPPPPSRFCVSPRLLHSREFSNDDDDDGLFPFVQGPPRGGIGGADRRGLGEARRSSNWNGNSRARDRRRRAAAGAAAPFPDRSLGERRQCFCC